MNKLLPKTILNPKGFTLVELMVVITIIAVLAVTGFVVYSNVSARGRDIKRMTEIDAISKALETNYQPGAATPYQTLANANFANNLIPTDPRNTAIVCGAGNAQSCVYCAYPRDTAQAVNMSTTAGVCGTMSGVNTVGVVSTTVPAAGTGYVVCANLETAAGATGNRFYCKANAQ